MSGVHVKKSNSTINVGSNAQYAIDGDDNTIQVGDDSVAFVHGSGNVIDVAGTDDIIAVSGNGAAANASDDDVVTFHAPGRLRALADSSVAAQADYAKVTLVGDDTLSIVGVGDVVNASGLDDGVSIGQNGVGAVGAARDFVFGLNSGSLLLFDNSAVWAAGSNFTATLTGHDSLTATGDAIQIYATGDDNTVTTGGNNQTPGDDEVVHMSGGVVKVLEHSSVDILGDNLLVRAQGNDAISLTGANDRLSLGAYGNNVTIGQNGNPNAGLDVVQFAYTPLVEPITVLQQSNVRIVGSNANVTLGGDDQVTLVGFAEQIVDQTGNNDIAIGGNGSVFFGQANNYVAVAPGDTVSMLANSNLTLFSPSSVTNGQYAVHMSVKDALSIDRGMTVYVPVAVGDDLLMNFGSTDVLQLASHYASINDLIGHASQNSAGRTVLQLDAQSDTLTLGMDKATFTTYAQEGLIKFR